MKNLMIRNSLFAAATSFGLLASNAAGAATATGQFNVRLTITAECKVQSATDLDFGSHGVIDSNVDATNTLTVQCTNGTAYNIGLDAGGGAGASVAARKMTGPSSATVTYSIYQDAARTLVWGNTISTDTLAGTGNGDTQAITAYGRVPPQVTPANGDYSDIIHITVTY